MLASLAQMALQSRVHAANKYFWHSPNSTCSSKPRTRGKREIKRNIYKTVSSKPRTRGKLTTWTTAADLDSSKPRTRGKLIFDTLAPLYVSSKPRTRGKHYKHPHRSHLYPSKPRTRGKQRSCFAKSNSTHFKAAYTRQTVMRFYYTSQFPALSLYLHDSPTTKIFINFQEVFVLYFKIGFCLDPHNSSQ